MTDDDLRRFQIPTRAMRPGDWIIVHRDGPGPAPSWLEGRWGTVTRVINGMVWVTFPPVTRLGRLLKWSTRYSFPADARPKWAHPHYRTTFQTHEIPPGG